MHQRNACAFAAALLALLLGFCDAAEGTTGCVPLTAHIDATAYTYCYRVSATSQMFYNLLDDSQELEACLEILGVGYMTVGFGIRGDDFMVGWPTSATTADGGDYWNHWDIMEDTVQNTVVTSGAMDAAAGTSAVCWRRDYNTGDTDDDVVITPDSALTVLVAFHTAETDVGFRHTDEQYLTGFFLRPQANNADGGNTNAPDQDSSVTDAVIIGSVVFVGIAVVAITAYEVSVYRRRARELHQQHAEQERIQKQQQQQQLKNPQLQAGPAPVTRRVVRDGSPARRGRGAGRGRGRGGRGGGRGGAHRGNGSSPSRRPPAKSRV